jgi:DNA repair protein RadB
VNASRLPFGVRSLDNLLGGGIELGNLTEFYGEGGSGKTNLCAFLACRVAAEGHWVVYIDTEGLSIERLSQIAVGQGTTLSQVIQRVLLTTPKTLDEQEKAIERTSSLMREKTKRLGLVVLDSSTLLYRLALGQEDEEVARQSLSTQLATLLYSALDSSIPVVFTNQVWRDTTSSTFEPIGGSFVNHIAKTIIRLERLKDGWRRAVLVKHRSIPDGRSADFRLTDRGVE